jgi:hypothetical protein
MAFQPKHSSTSVVGTALAALGLNAHGPPESGTNFLIPLLGVLRDKRQDERSGVPDRLRRLTVLRGRPGADAQRVGLA